MGAFILLHKRLCFDVSTGAQSWTSLPPGVQGAVFEDETDMMRPPPFTGGGKLYSRVGVLDGKDRFARCNDWICHVKPGDGCHHSVAAGKGSERGGAGAAASEEAGADGDEVRADSSPLLKISARRVSRSEPKYKPKPGREGSR